MIADEVAAALSASKMLGIVLVVALVFGVGFGVAAWWYGNDIEQLKKDNTTLSVKYGALTKQVIVQNDAIDKLKQAGVMKDRQIADALAEARKNAEPLKQRAQQILASHPPAGVDECRAAQQAFDAELKQERGQ